MKILRHHHLKPVTLGLKPSFGYGDRLGSATPGHLAAHRQAAGAIQPIFAQQSIREMQRTDRKAKQVMHAAADALEDAEFDGEWGADADHLKTEHDVDVTMKAGFVFFTIDPSDHVDGHADTYDHAALASKFDAIKRDIDWLGQYRGKTIQVDGGPSITFDEQALQRAAVKYGAAIRHTLSLASYIKQQADKHNQPHEIELSVDETPQPTSAAEHYIIADQCCRTGMNLVSLAPRFVGDFEKGIDYKGDLKAFEQSLAEHVAIAKQLGPYKLSLHSGSDKLSIYPTFARVTEGLFHVKTAGTSYLEALRVVARHDDELFRDIVSFSREHFVTDRATYHISATLEKVLPPADVGSVADLERLYLNEDDGRQILHVTFGSVLTDALFKPAVRDVLKHHQDTHRDVLCDHFAKHLNALREGM